MNRNYRQTAKEHELELVLGSMKKALNSRGYYVMLNLPVMKVRRGQIETLVIFDLALRAELILAKSGPSLFDDTMIRRERFRISKGGMEYLGSKYLPMGNYETFDDIGAATSRFVQLLDEVSVYRVLQP